MTSYKVDVGLCGVLVQAVWALQFEPRGGCTYLAFAIHAYTALGHTRGLVRTNHAGCTGGDIVEVIGKEEWP